MATRDHDVLPDYAEQLAAFHRAFSAELRAVIRLLPMSPGMRVLDAGCGDGFYTGLLAERLLPAGEVIGLDVNRAYLELARQSSSIRAARCQLTFVAGEVSDLPLASGGCDLVWCAQSLFSLPDPVDAVRQMAAALHPGGLLAVLENDSLHQLLLPWPSHLELALRGAEFAAFSHESARPGKFYVGRRLPAVFAAAGLQPLGFRTQCIDRQVPLDGDLEQFLGSYLENLAQRVRPYLDDELAEQLAELMDPASGRYLPRQPYFTMSWINVLTWGRHVQGERLDENRG